MSSEEMARAIYQLSDIKSEIDVEIHDFKSRCGVVNYIDENPSGHPTDTMEDKKVQGGNDDFDLYASMEGGWMFGGKKTKTNNQSPKRILVYGNKKNQRRKRSKCKFTR